MAAEAPTAPVPSGALGREEQVFVALVRAADRLLGRLATLFATHGLTPSQYNTLRILRGAGAAGRTCGEIGARLLTRDPDVTRLVDRLVARGLVDRNRDAHDRRVVRNRITPAGVDLLATLDAPLTGELRRLLGPLGKRRLESLAAVLGELEARAVGAPASIAPADSGAAHR